MVHEMRLLPTPYEQIADGCKTVELRLYDKKRQRIGIGDVIVFTNTENKDEKLAAMVSALYRYASFEDLFQEITPAKCGFQAGTTVEEAAAGMRVYYSDEEVRLNGVLGIRLKPFSLNEATQMKKREEETLFEELFPDGMK